MALSILTWLRSTRLRRPIIRLLVRTHNWSYRMIGFFASHGGQHPKHQIQNYHDFFVKNVEPHHTVLDVGTGRGDVAFDVACRARHVTGIDSSLQNIAQARQRYQRPNLEFFLGDATTYDFGQPYDVIVLSNVLEHIEQRVEFLRKLSALAPTLLIRVPLITRDWISVYKKNEGFEYRLDDTHHIEYDEATFRDELRQANLDIAQQAVTFGELYAVVRRCP